MTVRETSDRRQWLQAAGVSAAALAWPGLAAAAPSDAMLRIVGPWELSGIDPARSGYMFTRMQVAETLVDADDAGRPTPALAVEWHVSPDRLTWRFRLREGARFHDGSRVEAKHVAWVLERARSQPGALANLPLVSITASIDGDGSEVVFRLSSPFAGLSSTLAHSANQILAPAAFDAKRQVIAVIGSGPYRLTSLTPPQSFEVARFEGFAMPAGGVQRASYLSVSRPETRALLAESQQADLAWGLDPASLKRLRSRAGVRVLSVTIPRTVILKLDAGHAFLRDAAARQAISLAIDREGIATGLLRDPGLAAMQLFPPSLPDWHDASLAPLRTDPPQARALLASLGWKAGRDGILLREGGQRFSLTLRTFFDRPELPLLAAALQEQLRLVGIEIRVEIGNAGDIPLGHRQGTLQMGLTARNYANFPDPLGTLREDFAPAGGDWGAMHWHSPVIDAALPVLAASADPVRDAPLRREVVKALQEGLPVVPIAWYRQTAALSRRIDRVSIDPLERSYRLTDMRWAAA